MFIRRTVCATCFLFIAFHVSAQTPSGEITGHVLDPSGSVVPSLLTLTNPATNAVRAVHTNESGWYFLPALQPGVYNLKVELSGFRTLERKDVQVQVGSSNRIDFTLQLGNLENVLEVLGGAPVLETETTSVGTVIENRRIVETPLNGRNYLQLTSLIPGATTNGPSSPRESNGWGASATASP